MADSSLAKPSLSELYQDVLTRIRTRADLSHRDANEITLVAISKTHPAETIKEALRLGITEFGENRVQEAESKISIVGRTSAKWHLVGHLQANKARRAVQLFDLIHSLDSVSLARRLDRLCEEENRPELPMLIQVDLAGEEAKSGVPEHLSEELATAVNESQHLKLVGLMVLPPYFEDVELVRPYFRRLRGLRDQFKEKGYFGDLPGELSMGMSHDFEIAIEEGATMLRVGTALFGERS